MTAFYFAASLTVISTVGLYLWAKRRPVGQPMTWGEAFVAGIVVFAYMVLIYGILPNDWLQWCDGPLKWRSDKIGIPLGPLHYMHLWGLHLTLLRNGRRYLGIFPVAKGVLFPYGITFFGRGKLNLNAQSCRDIGATLIYGVMIGVHFKGWLWWQKRGQVKSAPRELPTSAYGRPLVKKV